MEEKKDSEKLVGKRLVWWFILWAVLGNALGIAKLVRDGTSMGILITSMVFTNIMGFGIFYWTWKKANAP